MPLPSAQGGMSYGACKALVGFGFVSPTLPKCIQDAFQVHPKSKFHVTPHTGHLQCLTAHGKWRGWPWVSPHALNGYPQHGLRTCCSKGSGNAGKAVGIGSVCHRDRTQQISMAWQDPGDSTAAGRCYLGAGFLCCLARAGLDAPWRNRPQQSCWPRARSCPCVHQHRLDDIKSVSRTIRQ